MDITYLTDAQNFKISSVTLSKIRDSITPDGLQGKEKKS